MLKTMLGFGGPRTLATNMCMSLGARARDPVFFAALGVPDTIDGRFDMMVLHAWLVLDRLRGLQMKEVSQSLVDTLFVSFDESLRELGVGDIGIGHRVKKMADAFYGRLSAYGTAVEQGAMTEALLRNVYRGESGHESDATILADYVCSARARLASLDPSERALDFGPLPVLRN